MTTIVWFRQDLRLSDNPALDHAAGEGDILPVFILDQTGDGFAKRGAASNWWLHHSLAALKKELGGLVLRSGDPQKILKQLIEETGAEAVVWNRCYEPHAVKRDKAIKSTLTDDGVSVESFNAALLHEPWTVETGSGGPYKVFTPFWRNIRTRDPGAPTHKPRNIKLAKAKSETLDDWNLTPSKPDWAEGWSDIWTPGEEGARNRLDQAECLQVLHGDPRLVHFLHRIGEIIAIFANGKSCMVKGAVAARGLAGWFCGSKSFPSRSAPCAGPMRRA